MKNQQIAINRATLFVVLMVLFTSLFTITTTQKVMGQSNGTTITTWAFTGPVPSSPNFSLFTANAIQGMMNGGNIPVGDPNTPAYWAPITSGSIPAWHLISTPNYNSWNGIINPSGSFANEFGCRLNFGYNIQSSTPFTFSQIHYTFDSSFFHFENTFNGSGITYSFQNVGIWFGADGIENTIDDVFYNTPGHENSLVNRITGVGLSSANQSMSGPPEQSMNSTIRAITIGGPYTITAEYSLAEIMGTRSILITIPEPTLKEFGIMTILFLIGIYFARFLRKKVGL